MLPGHLDLPLGSRHCVGGAEVLAGWPLRPHTWCSARGHRYVPVPHLTSDIPSHVQGGGVVRHWAACQTADAVTWGVAYPNRPRPRLHDCSDQIRACRHDNNNSTTRYLITLPVRLLQNPQPWTLPKAAQVCIQMSVRARTSSGRRRVLRRLPLDALLVFYELLREHDVRVRLRGAGRVGVVQQLLYKRYNGRPPAIQ